MKLLEEKTRLHRCSQKLIGYQSSMKLIFHDLERDYNFELYQIVSTPQSIIYSAL